MNPFDPDLEFEDLVLTLNESHRPGGVTSGKTRNSLIRAWALVAGRERAERDLKAAIERHGSKTALLRQLRMAPGTLREFECYLTALTEKYTLPRTSKAFRDAFHALAPDDQLNVAEMAADLLREPLLLRRLVESKGRATKLLGSALRVAELLDAVERLRGLLASSVAEERVYQDWCDMHSWVFGSAHQPRDRIRRVHDDSIVDLLLPDVLGHRDVVELKRPDALVLRHDRSHQTYFFSTEAAKAYQPSPQVHGPFT